MSKVLKFKDYAINNRKYYIADFQLTKNASNIPHTHDFYEFIVVIKGEFRQIINGHEIILSKKHVYFLHPTDEHSLDGTGQYNTNILRNIALDKDFFEQCINEVGIENNDRIFQCYELDDITYNRYKIKTELLLQLNNSEQTNHFLVKSILSDMFINGLLIKTNRKDIPKWLQNTYMYLYKDKNYLHGIDKLVEISGKSQEHLTREFKRYYGITPSEHINNVRLQKAATKLRTSQDKIIDIIFECGFQNVSYFNRLFKKKFAVKPSEYRAANKNIFNTSI